MRCLSHTTNMEINHIVIHNEIMQNYPVYKHSLAMKRITNSRGYGHIERSSVFECMRSKTNKKLNWELAENVIIVKYQYKTA